MRRATLLLASALTVSALAAGCSSAPEDPDVLVLYSSQHPDMMDALTQAFTAKTGIKVELRKDQDTNLANLIVKEGKDSPADVLITENSPAMGIVDRAGLFAPLPAATVAAVPAPLVSAGKTWTGIAKRSTVFVYDPKKFADPASLPTSMLDLEKPEWKGRFGYAPKGADFQAIVAAVYALKGVEGGDAFVQALKDNGTPLATNFTVMQEVNAGRLDAGVIYHYYWYKDRAAGGDNSRNAELRFFGDEDPGAFQSVSGAGILKSTNRAADATAFVDFLTSEEGQKVLADSRALEYPVDPDVAPNPALESPVDLDPPTVPVSDLDGGRVIAQLRKVGIL
jgi:iron(III) transport system substrate-binding protein